LGVDYGVGHRHCAHEPRDFLVIDHEVLLRFVHLNDCSFQVITPHLSLACSAARGKRQSHKECQH
jgi:hypothetical protein